MVPVTIFRGAGPWPNRPAFDPGHTGYLISGMDASYAGFTMRFWVSLLFPTLVGCADAVGADSIAVLSLMESTKDG